MNKLETTNPQLIELISFLKKHSRKNKAEIWRTLAEQLAKSRKKRAAVNISRINRYTEEKDTVAVPGKVLGAGELDHPVTVAAFAFSKKAVEKIQKSGGTCLSLRELAEKNPEGSNVKIIG
ncbi:MAG: 50S ribosomal protein L18e [Candidatus Bathyarchaeota archaeon]|nr:50S ribosomal protein L18e [Candidatus Bathyarchaeota archaeon]MCX8178062.1 50S ribosomal protein L18e [Candidatus Bathyarchaeota archaeon]MDW8194331.1 50S ribosomal protein L18e [Nitrososphaerota archaeon]